MDPGQPAVAAPLMALTSVADAPFWFWWLVPVVSTVLVVAVLRWSRRDRRPTWSDSSVEEYARFRAALEPPDRSDRVRPAR